MEVGSLNYTPCAFPPCENKIRAHGLCGGHYQQQWSGAPLRPLKGQEGYVHHRSNPIQGRAIIVCSECGVTARLGGHGRCGKCYAAYNLRKKGPCSVADCERPQKARGLCNTHYQVARKGLDLDNHPITERNRFGYYFSRVLARGDLDEIVAYIENAAGGKDGNGCINWPGGVTKLGYGRYNQTENKKYQAHRIIAGLAFGHDDDLPIHHKCANRRCVNPDHLVPVTVAENNAEMMARNYYERRIKRLETALRTLAPNHELLND